MIEQINEVKSIVGSKKTYDRETILGKVNQARLNGSGLESITNTGGLYDKVVELLEKEQLLIETKIAATSNFTELFQVLVSINYIKGSSRNYESTELVERIKDVIAGKSKLDVITTGAGLRRKVNDLMEKKAQAGTEEKPIENLYLNELTKAIAALRVDLPEISNRRIYLKLSLKFHPDHNDSPDATEVMKLLNAWKDNNFKNFNQ